MFGKSKFKYLQRLELANSTLLIALITEMSDKGLIDGKKVMKSYDEELDNLLDKLIK